MTLFHKKKPGTVKGTAEPLQARFYPGPLPMYRFPRIPAFPGLAKQCSRLDIILLHSLTVIVEQTEAVTPFGISPFTRPFKRCFGTFVIMRFHGPGPIIEIVGQRDRPGKHDPQTDNHISQNLLLDAFDGHKFYQTCTEGASKHFCSVPGVARKPGYDRISRAVPRQGEETCLPRDAASNLAALLGSPPN
jgi:hypothetical protein